MILKIGHLTVPIIPMSDELADEMDCEGCYIPREGKILIRESASTTEQIRILTHEIIHAFFDAYGWEEKRFDEEQICRRIDWGMTNLWMDNPNLLTAISKVLLGQRSGIFGCGAKRATRGTRTRQESKKSSRSSKR